MDAASQTQMKRYAPYTGRSILALVDLSSDKNEHGQQNQPDHGDSKRVHFRRKKAVVGPNMFER